MCASLPINETIILDRGDINNHYKISPLKKKQLPSVIYDPFQKVYEDLGINPQDGIIPPEEYNVLGKLRDNDNSYKQVWTPWLTRAAVHVAKVSDDGEFLVIGGGYLLDTELHIYRWNNNERCYLKVWEAGSGIINRDIYDVAFGDSDNNNLIEIAAACADGRVYLFEQAHISDPIANLENRFDFVWKSDNFFQVTAVEFHDLDLDGDEDLIIGSWDKKVHIFECTDHSGYPFDIEHWLELTERWNSTDLDEKIQSLGVGDFNNNGLPDFIVGTLSGSIYIFENDGTVMSPYGIEFPFPNDNDYRLVWNNSGLYQPIWNPIGQIATGELDDGDIAMEAVILAWGQGAWVLHYTDERGFYLEQLIQNFEGWQMVGAYPFENFADWMVRSESMNWQVYYQDEDGSKYPEPWDADTQNTFEPTANSAVTGEPAHSLTQHDGIIYNRNEYKLFKSSKVLWTAAKAACEALGGHLVVITSPEENEFITDLVLNSGLTGGNARVHIGLTDSETYGASEGNFKWITDDIKIYNHLVPSPAHGLEDFVELMADWNGAWNDIDNIDDFRYYVCEWENNRGGVLYNGHEYRGFTTKVSWTAAKAACETLGGHLVTITSVEESSFVHNLAGSNYVWIGLSDVIEEGNWDQWITGESCVRGVDYTNWGTNQPDNYGGIEHYGHMRTDGTWNDLPATSSIYYICEWDSLDDKHTTFYTNSTHNNATGTWNLGKSEEVASNGNSNPDLYIIFDSSTGSPTPDPNEWNISLSNNLIDWHQIDSSDISPLTYGNGLSIDVDPLFAWKKMMSAQYIRLTLLQDNTTEFKERRVNAIVFPYVARPLTIATSVTIDPLSFSYNESDVKNKIVFGGTDGRLLAFQYEPHNISYYKKFPSKLAELTEIPATDYGIVNPSFNQIWDSYTDSYFNLGETIWSIQGTPKATYIPSWRYIKNGVEKTKEFTGFSDVHHISVADCSELINPGSGELIVTSTSSNDIKVYSDETGFELPNNVPVPSESIFYFINGYSILSDKVLTTAFGNLYDNEMDELVVFPWYEGPFRRPITYDPELYPQIWYYTQPMPNNDEYYYYSGILNDTEGHLYDFLAIATTYPSGTIVDVNNDTLEDIIISNGKLAILWNVGTASNPRFKFDSDYFEEFNDRAPLNPIFSPNAWDYDQDGDYDIAYSYQSSSHGGVFYLGNEYKLFYDTKTWTEAKAACQAYGGHLVTVTTSAENTFVSNLARSNRIWIGLTDEITEGVWKWVTDEPYVSGDAQWSPGEPNNAGSGEDYVEMYTNGLWNDLPGASTRYYVCEWEAGQTGFRYGMDFFENQGTFGEPQWVRNAYMMKNPTTDGSLRFNNYTFGVIVSSNSNKSSAESLWIWNGVQGHIRNLIAETNQQNAYIIGTNPELVKLEVNLKQSPPDAINFGYSIAKSWSNLDELKDWTLTLTTSYGLDGDSYAEIIVSDYDNNVYVFEHLTENTYKRAYKTHNLNHTETTTFSPYAFQDLPGVPGTFQRTIFDHGNLAAAGLDYNNNGNEEFIIAAGFKIYFFEATGFNDEYEFVFETDFNSFISDNDVYQFSTMAITPDFDGRGSMIALGVSNQIFLLRYDPAIGWVESFQSTGGSSGFYNQPGNPNYHPDLDIRTMLFADLNQDNKTELWIGGANLTGTETGFLLASQSDFGNIHQFYEFNQSISTRINAFAISDSDFDGKLELIIAHADGIDIWEAEKSEILNFTRIEIITSDPNYGIENELSPTFGIYNSPIGLGPRAHDIVRLDSDEYFVVYGVEEEDHDHYSGDQKMVDMSDPSNGDGRLYYNVTSDPTSLGTAKNITQQLFNAPEDLLISEIFFKDNFDPSNISYHWIELYNPNIFDISLASITIRTENNNITLSDTIPARDYFVIARNSSVFNDRYGFNPNLTRINLEFDYNSPNAVTLYDYEDKIDSVDLYPDRSSKQRKNQSNVLQTADIPLDTGSLLDWESHDWGINHNGTPYERNYNSDDGIHFGIEYEPVITQLQNGTIFVSWVHEYNTSDGMVDGKCILARNFDKNGNYLTKTRLILNITVVDPNIQVQGLGTLEIITKTDQIVYLSYSQSKIPDYQGILMLQVIENGVLVNKSDSLGLEGYFIHSVDLININSRLGIIFAGYPRDTFYRAQKLYFTVLNSTYQNQGVFPITSGVGSAQFPSASTMENYPNRIAVLYERTYLRERLIGGQSEVVSIFSSDSGTTWSDSYVLNSDDPDLVQSTAGLVTEGGYNVISRQNYRPRVTDDGTGGILYQLVSRFLVDVSDPFYTENSYNSSYNLATQLWIGKIEQGHWFKFTDLHEVTAIAVGDTDNDLRNELFISHNYRVSLLEINQEIDGSISYLQKWQYQPPSFISLHPELLNSTYAQFFASDEARAREIGAVAIFDSNGNGWPELIFTLKGGDVFSFEVSNLEQPINDMYAITEEYLYSDVTFVSSSTINASDSLLIDVDGDGELDLIIADGRGDNGITAWDIEEDELLWRYTIHSKISKIYLIDDSVIMGITSEGILGVDLDGNEQYWIPEASLNTTNNHAFTDVDGDTVPDLIVATMIDIRAIEPITGEEIWDVTPDNNPQNKGYFDLTVGSIGKTTRISVCSSDFLTYKNVTILRKDGSIQKSFNLSHLTKFDTRSRSAIGDFDGNLQLDLAIAIFDNYTNESRLEVYDLSTLNIMLNQTIPIGKGMDLDDFDIYAQDVDGNSITDIILPIHDFTSSTTLFPSKGYTSAIFAIDVSTADIIWQRYFFDNMVKFEIKSYGNTKIILGYTFNSGLFGISLTGADILWTDFDSQSVTANIANADDDQTYIAVTCINGTGPIFKVTGMLTKANNTITPQTSFVKTKTKILYTDLTSIDSFVIPVIVTNDGTEKLLVAFNNGTLILRSFNRGEIWRIQLLAFSNISACGLEIEPGKLGLAFKTDKSDLFILEGTTTKVWAQVTTDGSIATSLSLDGSSDVLLLQSIVNNSGILSLFNPITKKFIWTFTSPTYFTYLKGECLDTSNIGIKTHIVALDFLGTASLIELPSTSILGGSFPAPDMGTKWVLVKSIESKNQLANIYLVSDGGELLRYKWLSNGAVSFNSITYQKEIVAMDIVDQGSYYDILLTTRNNGSQVWKDDGSIITFVSESQYYCNDSYDHHFANIDNSDENEIAFVVHNSLIVLTPEGAIIESHSFPEEIITVKNWKVDSTMKEAFVAILIDGTIAVTDPSGRFLGLQNGQAASVDFRDKSPPDQSQNDSEITSANVASKTQVLELVFPIFLTIFASFLFFWVRRKQKQNAIDRRRFQP